MASKSSIELTDATWNPITGCSKLSAGCVNCYAERFAHRLKAMNNPKYLRDFEVTLHPDLIDLPLRWRKSKRIFVNSMSDLFHEEVPVSFIEAVFSTMRSAHWHTFKALTKRADRLEEIAPLLHWPENVWMGVTVERQDYAWRVDSLRTVPASVRFLSCEPLLGPLDLNLDGIHWVVVGGESGSSVRPMNLDWARSLRDQCQKANVPFFLKQLGGAINRRGKEEALLDGQLWRETPTHPEKDDNAAVQRTLLDFDL